MAVSCTGSQQDSGLRRYIRQLCFSAGFMLPVAKLYHQRPVYTINFPY